MAMAHHGDDKGKDDMMERFRELEAKERFVDQRFGEALRKFPEGRIGADDDGELAFAVSTDADKNLVRIDFGEPCSWCAMPPEQAVELAQILIKQARAISKKPLSIVLH